MGACLRKRAGDQNLVGHGESIVKGLKCIFIDPDSCDVKIKLLWHHRHMESRRVVEVLETYGALVSVVRKVWRCPGMDLMETSN